MDKAARAALLTAKGMDKKRAGFDQGGTPQIEYGSQTGFPELDRIIAGLGNINQMFNPVESIGSSMEASQRMMAPETQGWDRVAAAGDMLSNVAGVVAPAAVAGRAGVPATTALMESFLGGSPAKLPHEIRGQEILNLLTSGRASEITNDMFNLGDEVSNANLSQYLYQNYDLPMDQASRMERANTLGYTNKEYRGTSSGSNRVSLRDSYNVEDGNNIGFWTSSNPYVASSYANPNTGSVFPFLTREPKGGFPEVQMEGTRWDRIPREETIAQGGVETPLSSYAKNHGEDYTSNEVARSAAQRGDAGVKFKNMQDAGGYEPDIPYDPRSPNFRLEASKPSDVTARFDTSGVRSPTARFDPRLEHLSHLGASTGGAMDFARHVEAVQRAGGQIAPSKYLPNVPRQVHAGGGKVAFMQDNHPLVPDVLYHGTARDIKSFDPDAKRSYDVDPSNPEETDTGWFGKGHYFTANPRVASHYAKEGAKRQGDQGANIIPAHVAMKNPFVVDIKAYNSGATELDKALSRAGVPMHPRGYRMPSEQTAALVGMGHDGVIATREGKPEEYVAFHPTQIKSSIGNQGTFDPNDPDITKAGGGKVDFVKDNPGGDWLANKQNYAFEYPRMKGIDGAITGWMGGKSDLFLPTHVLKSIEPLNNEKRVAGEPRFDDLMSSVSKEGFDPHQKGNKVVVAVNHYGQPYLLEGNTRVAVAHAMGVPSVKAEVRYWNGAEEADGPMHPDKVSAMAAPNDPDITKADGGRVGYEDGGDVGGTEPKNTVKAYKLFKRKKDGNIYPLFVNANKPVPIGQWLDAEEGPQGKSEGKVKSSLGDLAYRPGWHAGDLPVATHIGGKSRKELTAPDYRPDDHVWAEVEMPNDVDWQSVANSRMRRTADGRPILNTAHITDQLPKGGFYRYKTNPNMTGNWLIGGSMKVNRILPDDEVKQINDAAGTADLPRMPKITKAGGGDVEGDNGHIYVVHGGSDFDQIDPSYSGRGEPGNIRPLGNGLYGYVLDHANPESAENAIGWATRYSQKYGGGKKALHVYKIPKSSSTVFNGSREVDAEGYPKPIKGLGMEPQEKMAAYMAHRATEPPHTDPAWWDWSRKGSALYKDFQNAADLRMEHLPIGLTEVAIQNPKVATRIGKFSLDTPTSDILDAVKSDVQGGNITKAGGGDVEGEDDGITAYHGSAYDFPQFDINKLGTGTGHQAKGHGLYFAGNETDARMYREMLKNNNEIDVEHESGKLGIPLDRDTQADLKSVSKNAGGDPMFAAMALQGRNPSARAVPREKLADLIDRHRKSTSGHMYKVKLNVKPEELLDWDKPLSEQHPNVQAALSRTMPDYTIKNMAGMPHAFANGKMIEINPDGLTGRDAYVLSRMGKSTEGSSTHQDAKAASEHLLSEGIKGIRYGDTGSKNYVMFHHDPVQVTDKYEYGGMVGKEESGRENGDFEVGKKYNGVIPQIKYLPVHAIERQPSEHEVSRVSDDVARSMDFSEPVEATAFRYSSNHSEDHPSVALVNGHHRLAAARQTGRPHLPVTLTAVNAKGEKLNALKALSDEIERSMITKANGGSVDAALALTRRFTKDGKAATVALKSKRK